jgi:hypothetical protein
MRFVALNKAPPPPPPPPGTAEPEVDEEKEGEDQKPVEPSEPAEPPPEVAFNSDEEIRSLDGQEDTFADADNISQAETLTKDMLHGFSDRMSAPTMSRASSILSLAMEDPEMTKVMFIINFVIKSEM